MRRELGGIGRHDPHLFLQCRGLGGDECNRLGMLGTRTSLRLAQGPLPLCLRSGVIAITEFGRVARAYRKKQSSDDLALIRPQAREPSDGGVGLGSDEGDA